MTPDTEPDFVVMRELFKRHMIHARKLSGPSPVAQRNGVRNRRVLIAQAAGVPFSLVDAFAQHEPVPADALQKIHTAMKENWW